MYKQTQATIGACSRGASYRQQLSLSRAATHCVGEVCPPAPQLLTPTVRMWEWLLLLAPPCRALSSSLAQLPLWEAIRWVAGWPSMMLGSAGGWWALPLPSQELRSTLCGSCNVDLGSPACSRCCGLILVSGIQAMCNPMSADVQQVMC